MHQSSAVQARFNGAKPVSLNGRWPILLENLQEVGLELPLVNIHIYIYVIYIYIYIYIYMICRYVYIYTYIYIILYYIYIHILYCVYIYIYIYQNITMITAALINQEHVTPCQLRQKMVWCPSSAGAPPCTTRATLWLCQNSY